MRFILCMLLLPCAGWAADGGLSAADKLFDKGEYQAALGIYSRAAKNPGEEGLKAVYRSAECEALLFRYGEAAQRLAGLKLPPEPLWQGRFLLLRAGIGRQFLAQYGYSLPADEQKGSLDVTKLTYAQWRRAISADYDSLWALRGELLKYRMESQDYFAEVKEAELAYTPTLWDFAVLNWTDWLAEQEAGPRPPDAWLFVKPEFKAGYSRSAPPALKAAAIFEDAASVTAADMDFAREYWRLQRLLLPFEHGNLAEAKDPAGLRAAAAAVLSGWGSSFRTPLGRAWAFWKAAAFSEQAGSFKAAVDFCGKAVEQAPSSRPARECESLKARIEMPVLSMAASFAPPPGLGALTVNARNLPAVFFRAWRTEPEDLRAVNSGGEAWNQLRYVQETGVKAFLGRKPDLAWRTPVDYPAPYAYAEQKVKSPSFAKGIYVVIASGDSGFEPGSSLMRAVVLNITDVFLLGTDGMSGDPEDFLYDPARPRRSASGDIFRFYAADALTGKALAGADIDARYSNGRRDWTSAALKTGPDGAAALALPVTVAYPSPDYYTLDPLLYKDGAWAYWSSFSGARVDVPQPLAVYAETDRPVYRPGQEVKFKVTALLRQPRGWRAYDGKAAFRVTARDANWQEVFSKTMPVTGLGSAAGSFTVPAGRLLGNYSLYAELDEFGRNFSGQSSFGVEEYKRPEFEVKLGSASDAWRYGRKAGVSGEVKYYFGSPVPGAQVHYRVTRSRYIPWYCWYWSWFYGGGGQSEVASGDVKSGDDGRFSFEFTPQPESAAYAAYPSVYEVTAEARDAGGRTITDVRSYRAGSRAWNFELSPEAGFFTPEAPAVVDVRILDLNDSPRAGKASYELYRLEGGPAAPEVAGWGSFGSNPSLEQSFSAVKDGPRVGSGTLEVGDSAKAALKLKALAPGAYRLRLKARDSWGEETSSEIVIVSASRTGSNAGLKLPAVAIFEHPSYQPGETARVLIGASALKGARFAEVTAGEFVLSRGTLPGGGVSVYSLKVGREHRGGFGLRWFGAADFRIYSAAADAAVPLKDKGVSLDLDYAAVLAPGQEVTWRLRAKGPDGRPVSGEALVKIYDRSLEYYAAADGFWGDGLYPARYSRGNITGSLFVPNVSSMPVRTGLVSRMLAAFRRGAQEERLASLRVFNSAARGGRLYMAKNIMEEAAGGALMSEGLAFRETSSAMDMAPQAAAPGKAARAKMKDDGGGRESARTQDKPQAPVAVRRDFSETAYYNPQLKLVKGEAGFSFRIPERLTSWRVTSYMITRDVKRGSLSAETVTKKDLMVRLDLPRFLREGDRSRLTAVVTNDTKGELSGEVTLSVSSGGEEASAGLGLKELKRSFTVKAGGSEALYWDAAAPYGTAAYKVRAVARAGALADAQENDLPVLPSRERLIASGVAALDGDSSKTFRLPELEAKDGTRVTEALHLEVQPQLLLTVLNSLPFLVHYPYECTEQLLNRYVPLAITNGFYSRYPQLRAAVGKIPERSTLTPEWERDNPVRMMSLMETPWERESRGREAYWPAVDMLDPKVVAGEKSEALEKLKSYQNPDGSFPWFPGGRPSLHMTLYVLEGLAEASRYGVEIPEDMARRALSYALSEVPRHMKAEEGELAFVLYGSYVVTAFPSSWPESRTALTYAKAWADYADKHSQAMTQMGKAYAAYVYLRLGEKAKAESYLDRAMDGARTDEVSGTYWTPEKISWLWYNDTVEKHAFMLRTLLAVRPKDQKIPGMVRWLLFNRKSNEWKSTRASAAAIYSLLDVMKSKGALDKPERFSVDWGKTSEKLELQPFDWLARPLRWSKYGAEIKKAGLAPKVEKKGPGLAFASFTGIYTTDKQADESPDGMMNVSRRYFLRAKEGDRYTLTPLSSGDTVSVGDEIEVQLTVRTRGQFEYVHIKDPKGAGFEAETLTSGWRWEKLGRYEEPRDSLTNFFVEWLPHGEYVLSYRVRPTTPGSYKIGAAVMQSMYAPEFAAHSAGMTLNVR